MYQFRFTGGAALPEHFIKKSMKNKVNIVIAWIYPAACRRFEVYALKKFLKVSNIYHENKIKI